MPSGMGLAVGIPFVDNPTGGAAAWTPASLPGVVLWLDNSTLTTGSISQWNDSSGKGNHFTQATGANQPVVSTGGAGAVKAALFDGVNSYLQHATGADFNPTAAGYTMVAIMERGASSAGDFPQIIGCRPWNSGSDAGWGMAMWNTIDGNQYRLAEHYADGSTGHDMSVPSMATGVLSNAAFEMWEMSCNRPAGQTNIYKNGVLNIANTLTYPAGAVTSAGSAVYMGRDIDGSNSRKFNGWIKAVILVNGLISTGDRASLKTWAGF